LAWVSTDRGSVAESIVATYQSVHFTTALRSVGQRCQPRRVPRPAHSEPHTRTYMYVLVDSCTVAGSQLLRVGLHSSELSIAWGIVECLTSPNLPNLAEHCTRVALHEMPEWSTERYLSAYPRFRTSYSVQGEQFRTTVRGERMRAKLAARQVCTPLGYLPRQTVNLCVPAR
jgi:hypothetical protein